MVRQKTRKVLRLRQLRRGREMTQAALAARAGLSKAAICDIERGYRKPSLDTAKAIAQVFPDERLESLFDYVEVPA
jgi:DNA-binding XRE family transcriptional regulator